MPPPPSSAATTTPPTRPFHPSAAVLLIYPATLILGSLFSVLSPTAQPASPQPSSATNPLPSHHQQHVAINYFARKDNIFNIYFVKVGWAWMTLAFATILLAHPASIQRPRRLLQAGLRYILVTTVWYSMTQWFLGPPIIDRSFVWSGGRCRRTMNSMGEMQTEGDSDEQRLGVYLTAATCKSAGGAWRGGHDVSGHVFLLVLITAALGFEVLGLMEAQAESDTGTGAAEKKQDSVGGWRKTWPVRFVGSVIALSWWMLLMTGIWFHTWFEKFNGLVIASVTIYALYILPRRLIPWRNVVGIPGV
ncbi:hypothetical protein P175DRAFT_0501105 [Aspergillus ochraceoroseus IBT 24754]|uniref:Acyl-coenzyme A diphosphatase SCS3 n=2 Tax=Aspergillus subgen. Nidulantes TaxID=2720870 RepID=A0A0F8UB91_9EURO|nr:uncharacterized protein P175DRAFT_0501105 [Aspergillus ochraceoroseus IBT 24754]KKK17009.1 hypothetical protein ARAM_007189 [Aspergillus rambellii]PTU20489.1 hypothetical protein P175DRAFT_0501105 [Aspergillus ochraceoroseus IBT 24754]